MRQFYAAVFLIFASCLLVFLNLEPLRAPGQVATLCFHLGLSSILIREAVTRWNKGFASLLLLGAAYSLILSGIGSQNLFNPQSSVVVERGLSGYGWWSKVNVIVALDMAAAHTLFNTIVPITYTDAFFPGTAGRFGNKTLAILLLLFMALTVFMIRVPAYHPARGILAVIIALIFLLIATAKLIPPISLSTRLDLPDDLTLFISGFLGIFVFFMSLHNFQRTPNPLLNVLVPFSLLGLYGWLLLKLPDLPQHSKVAMAAGAYCAPTGIAVFSGHPISALVSIVMMAAAWAKSKHVESADRLR